MSKPKIKDELPEKQQVTEDESIKEDITEEQTPEETREAMATLKEEDIKEDPEKIAEDLKKDPTGPRPGAPAPEEISLKGEWTKPPVIPTEEQPFLFGEADQILNALDMELTTWRNTLEKLHEGKLKIEMKVEAALERIDALVSAVLATRKHAPMTEDPSPSEEIKEKDEKAFAKISHPTEIPEDQPEPIVTTNAFEGYQLSPGDIKPAKIVSKDAAPEDPDPSASVITVFRDPDAADLKVHVEREEVAPGAAERATQSKKELKPEDFQPGETYLVNSAGKIISEPDPKPATDPNLTAPFRNPTQPIPEVLFPGDVIETSWNTGPYRIEEIIGPNNTTEDLLHGGENVPCPDHWSLKCSDVGAKRNKDGRLPKNYDYSFINLVVAVGNRFLSLFAASEDEIMLTGESINKPGKIAPKITLTPSTEPSDEDLF